MVRAKVNIEDVECVLRTANTERECAQSVYINAEYINTIISDTRRKISCLSENNNQYISERTHGYEKLTYLKGQLSQLEEELRAIETLADTYNPETDENGSGENNSAERIELLREISSAEKSISTLEDLINRLNDKISEITRTIETLERAISSLTQDKEALQEQSERIYAKSIRAVNSLDSAISTIQTYCNETILIDPVQGVSLTTPVGGRSEIPGAVFASSDEMPSRHRNEFPITGVFSSTQTTSGDIETGYEERPPVSVPTWTSGEDLGNGEFFYGVGGRHYSESNQNLLSEQGMIRGYEGTCGITSTANVLRLLGVSDATEKDVLDNAINLNLCSPPKRKRMGGGTSNYDILNLMKSYNLSATAHHELTLSEVAECIDNGGVMMMSVHGCYLEPGSLLKMKRIRKKKNTDHWVTITGIKRNQETGDVTGVYVQDTGGFTSNSNILLSAEEFNTMRSISYDYDGIAIFTGEDTQ